MKKEYKGLEVYKIQFDYKIQTESSSGCFAVVTLLMDANKVCISPEDVRQIDWYNDQGL